MAKARALDRRRKSVRNIRKITRTMELIATARFKKAMDRSVAARDYTKHLANILENIAAVGADVVHPLLEIRPTKRTAVLVLTGNRGLCGGYNGNVVRQAMAMLGQWKSEQVATTVAVSGKRGITALKFRRVEIAERYTDFDDKPEFAAVVPIGRAYLDAYSAGEIDRLEDRIDTIESRRPPAQQPPGASFTGGPYSIPTYIVMCESGGNYSALNSSSGAGGAYQIIPSTWEAYGGNGLPHLAPKSEQDRIAALIWANDGPGAWVCA